MIFSRSRFALVATLGAVGLALGGCGTSGKSDDSDPARPVTSSSPVAGEQIDVPLSSQIMNLPLVTSTGKHTSLGAYRDKIVIISDAMTLCQESCPLDTANLVQLARKVDKAGLSDKVVFLSITIDPARDTPAQLTAYRGLFKPAPANWLTLTGKQADLTALWKHFGVWWKKVPQGKPPAKNWRTGKTLTYDIDHADELFLIKGGHERYVFTGPGHVEPGTLPGTLHGYLDDQGIKNLQQPEGDSWTVGEAARAVSALTGRQIAG